MAQAQPPGSNQGPGAPNQALTPANLMPRRNPNLIQRIAAAIFNASPTVGPQEEDKNTTQSGIVAEGLSSLYDRQFKFDVTRRATYADVEEIDGASEEAGVALDTIANNVCTSDDGVQMSFELFAHDPKVQAILDQVVQTCKLHTKIRQIVRNLVKYGDMFAEIIINLNGEIVNLKQLPPVTMFRNEDLVGNLLLGVPRYKLGKVLNAQEECAFEQKTEATGQMIAAFWPWQVLHIRLNHNGFSPYGLSHLRVARVTYKKLKALEESLIVGRLTRDILKLIFYIDTTGLSPTQRKIALQDFQQSVMQRVHVDGRRENPFSVMTDFFVSSGWIKLGQQVQPMQTKVDIIDPKNVGIHDITDIEYLHRKFTAALRVPRAHLGFEKDVNAKATLTIQDVQYVRFLRDIQQVVGHGLEQLFDTALILAGINPEEADYEISWPNLNAVDQMNAAQSEMWRAQAHAIYANPPFNAIDGQYIQQHVFNMTDEEMAEIQERIAAQQAAEEAKQMQQQQMNMDHEKDMASIKAASGGHTTPKVPGDQGQGKALPNPSGFRRSAVDKSTQGRTTRHQAGEEDLPPTPTNLRSERHPELATLAALLSEKVENLVEVDISRLAAKYHKAMNGSGSGHTN